MVYIFEPPINVSREWAILKRRGRNLAQLQPKIGKIPHIVNNARRKISEHQRGRPHPGLRGEKHPNWKGGISFGPYCHRFNEEFKERVRSFWGYLCGYCGKSQSENKRKLHVHHVDYKKDSCCNEGSPRRFIPLCNSCHSRSNWNKEKWRAIFIETINLKYGGKCYFPKR